MQAAIQERISDNAYRILGLPGDASQQAIDGAIRRMRIWPLPERIPPTPWDLPWVGKLSRTRMQLEQALARLNDPKSRVEERVLWFHTAQADLNSDSAQGMDGVARRLLGETDPARVHDGTLAHLQATLLTDPKVEDLLRWRRVLTVVRQLATSEVCLRWLLEAERNGDFEKRAVDEEVGAALRSLPETVEASLASKAQTALAEDDLAQCGRIARLVDDAGLRRRIVDRMEETLERRCELIRQDLRQGIQGVDHYSAHAKNAAVCRGAAEAYNGQVNTLLLEIEEIAGEESDAVGRVRLECARMLTMIAIGWLYAHDFVTAEQTLQVAAPLAKGTLLEGEINGRLAENAERAATQRRYQQMGPAARDYARPAAQSEVYMGGSGIAQGNRIVTSQTPPPLPRPRFHVDLKKPQSNSSARMLLCLVVIASAAMRLLSGLSGSSSSRNNFNYSPPQNFQIPSYSPPGNPPANPNRYTPPNPTPYRPPAPTPRRYSPPSPYSPPGGPGRR